MQRRSGDSSSRPCQVHYSFTGGEPQGTRAAAKCWEEDTVRGEDEEEWCGEGDLDPKMLKEGRREEVALMVKNLDTFEFGTMEEALERGGKRPTYQ